MAIRPQEAGRLALSLVARELSRRGVTPVEERGDRRQVLQCRTATGTEFRIRVRGSSDGEPEWRLNRRDEDGAATTFYVLTNVRSRDDADYFVVPASVVAEYCRERHRRWLSQPKRNGAPRSDSDMRKFADDRLEYLGRWDLLPA